MDRPEEIVRRVQSIFGSRLRGLFAFGSRISGDPRADSDLDLGVWLGEGTLRRRDSWIPWVHEFEVDDPVLDPSFLTDASLEEPPSWLLEAIRGGVAIWYDPTGALSARLEDLRFAIDRGVYRRKLFMGLPYYAEVSS